MSEIIKPGMRVYRVEPQKKRGRRWVRFALWTILCFALAGGAAVAFGAFKIRNAVDEITRATNPIDSAVQTDLVEVEGAKDPAVALVLGYDARAEVEGDPGRSDTMLFMRLDPGKKVLTMLSFPRDMLVETSVYSGPLNEAFAKGGPSLVIKVLQEATGIATNFYVPINFRGFIKTVDAFGGTWVDVDRRYFHSKDTCGGDNCNYAELDLRPGYQKLTGRTGLDFVRYRHVEGDNVGRIVRQQVFMREFKQQLDPLTVSTKALDLLGILQNNVKVLGSNKKKVGADTLLQYVRALNAIPRENIQQVKVSGTPVGGTGAYSQKIQVSETELRAAVQAFLRPDPTIGERASTQDAGRKPGTQSGATRLFTPETTPVDVRNGNDADSGDPASASFTQEGLVARGWSLAIAQGYAQEQKAFETIVWHGSKKGSREASIALAKDIGGVVKVKPITTEVADAIATYSGTRPQADVVLVLGQSYHGLPPAKTEALPAKEEARVQNAAGAYDSEFRRLERQAKIPLEKPRRVPIGMTPDEPLTDDSPYYAYQIGKKRAAHVTWNNGNPIGVIDYQAIDWKNPPILAGPTRETKIRGRDYRLYYNGSRLVRVAWTGQKGITHWLSAPYPDIVSNASLLSMATSFVPVP